jgi:hypothetical protein
MVIPRMRLILAVVLSLAIVVLGWILGAAPQLTAASLARADRAVVETQNDGHRSRLVQLQDQFARIDETRAELAALRLQVPTGNELPDFVDEVTAIAAAHSVEVMQYTAEESLSPLELQAAIAPAPAAPGPTAPEPTATEPTATEPTATEPAVPEPAVPESAASSAMVPTPTSTTTTQLTAQNLFAIPVSLSLRGTDTNVRAMLADLQGAPRLFFVTSATIAAEPVDGGPDASPDASLSEVRGYVYVVPLSAPTQTSPPAAVDGAAAADEALSVQ